MTLTAEQLEEISGTKEVLIETESGNRRYRTIIWVVVDAGEVFVRSFLGRAGRWYQRALANPEVSLLVGGDRHRFRARPATDPESVERTSNGFRLKYRPGRSLDAMVVHEVLDTTLRLEPID